MKYHRDKQNHNQCKLKSQGEYFGNIFLKMTEHIPMSNPNLKVKDFHKMDALNLNHLQVSKQNKLYLKKAKNTPSNWQS